MYLGSQVDTKTLRTYTWPEASNKLATQDVLVQWWKKPNDGHPPTAPSREGDDWLNVDDRLTAGWLSGKAIGFAWTVPAVPGDVDFRFPHIRVAILDKDNTKEVIVQPHIYSRDFTYGYPAAAPNSDGEVGIVVTFGGGKIYPSSAVGVLEESKRSWDLTTAMVGKAFPPDRRWGDYLTLRLDGRNSRDWVAASFVLEDKQTTQVGYQIFHIKQKPQ